VDGRTGVEPMATGGLDTKPAPAPAAPPAVPAAPAAPAGVGDEEDVKRLGEEEDCTSGGEGTLREEWDRTSVCVGD